MPSRRLDSDDVMPDIPHDTLTHLRRTHAAGVTLLASHGFRAEAVEVVIEVERHRWFWRPSKPRILLVAESHVFTSDEDRRIRIDRTMISRYGRANASRPPMDAGGITYLNTYFVRADQSHSASLHFHELVHVIQWR